MSAVVWCVPMMHAGYVSRCWLVGITGTAKESGRHTYMGVHGPSRTAGYAVHCRAMAAQHTLKTTYTQP